MVSADQHIIDTLDALSLALVEHNHQWSNQLRKSYEKAVHICKLRQHVEEERAAKLAEDSATPTNKHMAAKAQICPKCSGRGLWKHPNDTTPVAACPQCGGSGKLRHA